MIVAEVVLVLDIPVVLEADVVDTLDVLSEVTGSVVGLSYLKDPLK